MSVFDKVFVSNKVDDLSFKTKKTYKEYINVYLNYCKKNNFEISFDSAISYLDFMKKTYKSQSYINSLKFLLAKGLDLNVSLLPKYKIDKKFIKKINRHFSEKEFKKICVWAKDNIEFDMLAKFLLTMFVTGLRVSEVSRFTIKNFREMIEKKVTEITVKGNFVKSVYLPEAFIKYFELIVQMYGHLPNDYYLFCRSKIYSIGVIKLFRLRFYKLLSNLDIDKNGRSFHSIRRMFANMYLKATDYDISFIQLLLGHASIKTTYKYLGMSDEDILYRQNKCSNKILDQIF